MSKVIRKVAHRGGHNYSVTGANGYLNEVNEDRLINTELHKILVAQGIQALDVTAPNSCNTIASDLNYGTKKANDWGADVFVSIHLNSSATTYNYIGAEVCAYDYDNEVAKRIANNLFMLGFGYYNSNGKWLQRRGNTDGINKQPGLAELRNTNMEACIVEVCFVSSRKDAELYKKLGPKKVAIAIAEGILNKKISQGSPNATVNKPTQSKPQNNTIVKSVYEAKEFVGNRAKELQTKLIKVGYSVGKYGADGIYGLDTHNAVIKFQKDKGLTVDGLPGTNTFKKLDQIINSQNSSNYSKGRVTAKSGLNVRSKASTQSKVIGTLKHGEVVKLANKVGGWWSIYYGTNGGFVSSQYIEKI